MPVPQYSNYIAQITLPDGITYHIKDSEARQWIEDMVSGGLSFVIAWDGASAPVAANIPAGVKVKYNGVETTGTLAASASTKANIYLVHSDVTNNVLSARDIYEEYVTINTGTTEHPSWAWEPLGNTDISLDVLGNLAWKDNVVLNKGSGDVVLGEATTFTASTSGVTFTGGSSDTFVKSYPGVTNKLETTTITGTGSNVTFSAVDSNTSVTATNTVFGTDVTASKVVTENKTATNTVLGTATTASKATAGTAVTVATRDATATDVSYIGNSSTNSILGSATVTSETLTIGTTAVTQGSVYGTSGTESITPYTFADVTVPVISSNSSVTVASVKTNTDVTVPVVTSNTEVTATNTTTVSKTAATKASAATTVATGSLSSTDSVGATVMTGLGTATTASAVTAIGSGTAAAQTITVGTNDKVTVPVLSDLSISLTDHRQ